MKSYKTVFSAVAILSIGILGFLFWLLYFKTGTSFEASEQGQWMTYLPALNALLNTMTALFLIAGYVFIKKGLRNLHIWSMLAATVTSAFFLASYITYHYFHGDTKFTGVGPIRSIYFFVLITHIVCSMIQVPLILATLYLAAIKNFSMHKKFARMTFPIWLYVSVTGVLVFYFL